MMAEHKTHYVESDGNGGMRVSRSMIAFISLVLVLLGVFASTLLAFSDVTHKVDTIMDNFEDISGQHQLTLADLRSDIAENDHRIQEAEKNNAILRVNSDSIKESVVRIEEELKSINCKCD